MKEKKTAPVHGSWRKISEITKKLLDSTTAEEANTIFKELNDAEQKQVMRRIGYLGACGLQQYLIGYQEAYDLYRKCNILKSRIKKNCA